MLAVVYHGPEDLRVEQVPIPTISDDEILIKMISASICGTDLRIKHGAHRNYPAGTIRIPGHELVGDIVSIGKNIEGYHQGDRVFVAPNMGCGHCKQCISGNNNLCKDFDAIGITIDGGFAEYVRIPAAAILQGNIIPINKKVDPSVAALTEPFACVLRGQNALHIQPGDNVLIMGAGPIGVMHMLLAKLRGAGHVWVSEMVDERIEQVKKLGADRVINLNNEDQIKVVQEETNGQGADVVIVAAPSGQAQETALQIAGISARINFFGGLPKDRSTIQFDSNIVHYKELLVTATTACSTQNCIQASTIINSGRIDLSPLVTAKYRLEEALEAFTAAESRNSLKVVFNND